MNVPRFLFLPVLLTLLTAGSANAAASRQVRVFCQGPVPAEAYYYDGKESHPVNLADGQFTDAFAYAGKRFALFATPPAFDASGRLQTAPFAYADLPAEETSALILLMANQAEGKKRYAMLAAPSPVSGSEPTLAVFNLAPLQLGIVLDQQTAQIPAFSSRAVTLPPSPSSQKLARYQLRIAGEIDDKWEPLVISKLRVRTDRQGCLLLSQPATTPGANGSSSEPLAWSIVYLPGS